MNLFRLLRFFLPLQNPLGFGLTDFVELGVAALIVAALLSRDRIERLLRAVADRPAMSMVILAILPVALRLALLPRHPVPVAQTSDDFSYLLLGDTLAHFRFANPAHPMRRFFETVFVLQEPTYSSIYPPGQGFVLAIGELLFHLPWAGVALSIGALCALCYWMLRAWVSPVWALAGGLLAVMEFGPLNQWMNNYWGGAVSAIAGCLVFGAIPRIWVSGRPRYAALAGFGLGLQILTRPFESVLLAVCALPALVKIRRRALVAGLAALLPALLITAAQNKAVTGSWTTLPYMLSRYQYGVPTTFTFQKVPAPHRELTQEEKLDYQAQKEVHGDQPETIVTYLTRLAGRVRFFRFFFLPPLYAALLFFVPALRRKRFAWVAGCILLFSLGTNIYPYYYPHYIAAVTCLLVLAAVAGLQRLSRLRWRGFAVGGDAMRLISLLCVAHFLFWYGLHLFGNEEVFGASGPYESWDYVNFGDTEGRIAVNDRLAQAPGRQLVFVRYGPAHLLREWIHNDADIDRSRVVWALDLGPDEDAKLIRYYGDRTAWIVEPDANPPRLRPYKTD
ncbi:MAG TPA: hypothetical protein VHB50_14495 [Bryobacteraceae bacterium]|nr:hypothetical protein [Bryobacteraceae bacterium]